MSLFGFLEVIDLFYVSICKYIFLKLPLQDSTSVIMEKKLNFVLIDDDDIFNYLNQRVLKSANIAGKIITFSNAKDALAYFAESKENCSDIILLDIRMPEMDGFEFLEEFIELHCSNTNIFMLTSSLDEKDKEKAGTFPPVKGFLSKPLTGDKVNEIYGSYLK